MFFRIFRILLQSSEQSLRTLRYIYTLLPKYLSSNSVFSIITLQNSYSTCLKRLPGKIEEQYIPSVYKISLGGSYKRAVPDRELWRLTNSSFRYRSNFIRFLDHSTFNPKVLSFDSLLHLPADSDFIRFTSADRCRLLTSNKVSFDAVLHLTGTNSNNWGHFLVEYFPKLIFLADIVRIEPCLKIVLFSDTDLHILRMIHDVILDYPEVEVIRLPPNVEVFAKRLYYVCNDSYIADASFMPCISHVRVSNSTVNYLLSYYNNHCILPPPSTATRLFLGRRGGRSIKNYDKVLALFQRFHFQEVFPHLLSFDEKLKLFASAEFISGPLSSAFANVFFAPNVKEVLVLCNCSRHLDPYLANLSQQNNFNLLHFMGCQLDLSDENSSFELDTYMLDNLLCSILG